MGDMDEIEHKIMLDEMTREQVFTQCKQIVQSLEKLVDYDTARILKDVDYIESLEERNKELEDIKVELVEVLSFSGDPDSYFAIAIVGDRPCGDFADDFSDDHGFNEYDRPMPGTLAREFVKKYGE